MSGLRLTGTVQFSQAIRIYYKLTDLGQAVAGRKLGRALQAVTHAAGQLSSEPRLTEVSGSVEEVHPAYVPLAAAIPPGRRRQSYPFTLNNLVPPGAKAYGRHGLQNMLEALARSGQGHPVPNLTGEKQDGTFSKFDSAALTQMLSADGALYRGVKTGRQVLLLPDGRKARIRVRYTDVRHMYWQDKSEMEGYQHGTDQNVQTLLQQKTKSRGGALNVPFPTPVPGLYAGLRTAAGAVDTNTVSEAGQNSTEKRTWQREDGASYHLYVGTAVSVEAQDPHGNWLPPEYTYGAVKIAVDESQADQLGIPQVDRLVARAYAAPSKQQQQAQTQLDAINPAPPQLNPPRLATGKDGEDQAHRDLIDAYRHYLDIGQAIDIADRNRKNTTTRWSRPAPPRVLTRAGLLAEVDVLAAENPEVGGSKRCVDLLVGLRKGLYPGGVRPAGTADDLGVDHGPVRRVDDGGVDSAQARRLVAPGAGEWVRVSSWSDLNAEVSLLGAGSAAFVLSDDESHAFAVYYSVDGGLLRVEPQADAGGRLIGAGDDPGWSVAHARVLVVDAAGRVDNTGLATVVESQSTARAVVDLPSGLGYGSLRRPPGGTSVGTSVGTSDGSPGDPQLSWPDSAAGPTSVDGLGGGGGVEAVGVAADTASTPSTPPIRLRRWGRGGGSRSMSIGAGWRRGRGKRVWLMCGGSIGSCGKVSRPWVCRVRATVSITRCSRGSTTGCRRLCRPPTRIGPRSRRSGLCATGWPMRWRPISRRTTRRGGLTETWNRARWCTTSPMPGGPMSMSRPGWRCRRSI
jgi:hypothetical protein